MYAGSMAGFERDWLYRKPFDDRPGNEQFYLQLYAVVNLLRAMDVSPGGRILEVGSGPGWVTEILMLLGFAVDGVEPSAELIAIARERIELAKRHYHVDVDAAPHVAFLQTTVEDVDCEPETYDAVLFHDALHHVLDEDRTLETCFRALKRGGVLGISEDAWRPGNREQESALEEEIDRFGTHESPFTREYLNELLERHGFRDVQRYHAINGFFPEETGDRAVREWAQSRAENSNNLVARKPAFDGPTTADVSAETTARIEVVASRFHPADRKLTAELRLHNTGESLWLHRPRSHGFISIALRTEPLDAPDCREARPRHRLPRELPPGETVTLALQFFVDAGYERFDWRFDLVNEGVFWLSQRGSPSAPVRLA